MDLDDLISEREPPLARLPMCHGPREHHLTEGAVMIAYAMHLLRLGASGAVQINPDGEHGKRFPFREWLANRGFMFERSVGTTTYGGYYRDAAGREIVISLRPGEGDVTAEVDGVRVFAECKGGIINTKHPGQVSRLSKGLRETIGQLMATPPGGLQVAVVPDTPTTRRLAERLAARCRLAGIGIALVGSRGEISDVGAKPAD